MLRAAQAAARLQAVRPAQLAMGSRLMASGFDERERGEERVYFNKQERQQLENLLKKVQTQNDKAPEGQEASDDTKLKVIAAHAQTILGKDLDSATLAALKAWKRGEA